MNLCFGHSNVWIYAPRMDSLPKTENVRMIAGSVCHSKAVCIGPAATQS